MLLVILKLRKLGLCIKWEMTIINGYEKIDEVSHLSSRVMT